MRFSTTPITSSGSLEHNSTNRLHRIIVHKYTAFFVLLLAVIAFLPMCRLGFTLDDHIHYQFMNGSSLWFESGSWLTRLFTFFDTDINRTRDMIERIALLWWADDSIKINFFRPFSALTLWLDYQFWPDSIALKHLHSIAWYAALIGVVYVLFNKLLQQRSIVLLATFIFTFDFAHYMNVSWIAGRNALIATFFGILALYFHHLWITKKTPRYAFFAAVCFLFGLLAGEAGVAAGAYLLSYSLFLDRGGWLKRVLRLAPYGLLFIAWWLAYKSLGFGTSGTGFYLDPGRYPAEFVGELFHRWPTLLFLEWSGLPATMFLKTLIGVPVGLLVIMILFLGVVLWLLWPLLKRSDSARFWLIGSTLAMLPSASVLPQERVLLFADVGGAALLAQLLFAWSDRVIWFKPHLLKSLVAGLLFIIHVCIHPLVYLGSGVFNLVSNQGALFRLSTALPIEEVTTDQQMVFLNQPYPVFFSLLILSRSYYKMPVAQQNYILGSNNGSMEITRLTEHSIRVRMENGVMPENSDGRYALIFRRLQNPLTIGETIVRGQCQYKIEELTPIAAFPRQFQFICSKPLDDPLFVWLVFENNATVKWLLPEVGETVLVTN